MSDTRILPLIVLISSFTVTDLRVRVSNYLGRIPIFDICYFFNRLPISCSHYYSENIEKMCTDEQHCVIQEGSTNISAHVKTSEYHCFKFKLIRIPNKNLKMLKNMILYYSYDQISTQLRIFLFRVQKI